MSAFHRPGLWALRGSSPLTRRMAPKWLQVSRKHSICLCAPFQGCKSAKINVLVGTAGQLQQYTTKNAHNSFSSPSWIGSRAAGSRGSYSRSPPVLLILGLAVQPPQNQDPKSGLCLHEADTSKHIYLFCQSCLSPFLPCLFTPRTCTVSCCLGF